MATSLTAKATLKLSSTYTNPLDLSTPVDSFLADWSKSFTNGTGTDQANLVWHDTRTLAGTSEDLDLNASLTSTLVPGAVTVKFTNIKILAIRNNSTTTTEILAVGGAAGTQFVNWVANSSDIVNIGPSGMLILISPIDGYAVGAGASDLLKINSAAATFTYDIWLVGIGTVS